MILRCSSLFLLNKITWLFCFMFTPEVSAQTSNFYDKILVNGHIITVDKNFRIAEAVAIRDGRFIAIGSNKAIESLADPNVEVIDLKGRTVVPGFIDGHAHMDREGLKFILPSLDGVRSIDDILEVIKQEVEKKKPGEWIVTMPIGDYPNYAGGSDLLKEKRYPTRWDLDRVAPDNPVYIKGIWFYWSGKPPIVSIANSYALKLAGITRDTQGLHPGMTIVKEPDSGEPNGIFEELGTIGTIEYSLMKIVPRFSHEQRVAALKYSMHQYNAAGTTSIYEGHGLAPAVIRAYKELWENKEMSVRSHLTVSPAWDAVPGAHPEMVLRDWAIYAGGRGLGDDMLKISGIYTAVGSSPQDNIRRKDSPYPGWAGYSVDSRLQERRGSLYDLILAAARANLRANAITYFPENFARYLNVFEQVNRVVPITEKRFVLEHLRFVTEAQQDLIKELGVVPTVLPGKHIWSSGLRSTRDSDREEINSYIPLKSFVDKGIIFVLATDNVPFRPLHTLGAAITRKDGVTGQVIGPDQKISRADALRAFTINGAYLSFEEHIKGSIEVGKLADLAVLSADLLTVPEDDIRQIRVLMTMVGGKIVFQQP